jgi:hypothetical protein
MRKQVSRRTQESIVGKTPSTRLRRRTSRIVRSDMFVEEIFLGSISGKL